MDPQEKSQSKKDQTDQPQRFGLGPSGICMCPECGKEVPHKRGVPCYEEDCPVCGAEMIRKA